MQWGSHSSVNSMTKGSHNNNSSREGRDGGLNGGGGDLGGRGGGGRNTFQPGACCQICGKEGHPAPRYFKRYDNNYNGPPQKQALSAITGYGVDTNWYMDPVTTHLPEAGPAYDW
jgi:hypothetical protein